MKGEPIEQPYASVCAWLNASPHVRPARSRQQISAYKRIASLPAAWGERLDAMGATYGELRWLAGAANPQYSVERGERYRGLVELLSREWPDRREHGRAFEKLMASMPKLGARKAA